MMDRSKNPITHASPRRLFLRSRERGAAIFVVMMVIMLLTGLGTWVVYASGLAASSAGNQRAATQTQYLAELAVLSGTGFLAQPGELMAQYQNAEKQLVANTPDYCLSTSELLTPTFCKNISMSDINTTTVRDSTYSVLDLGLAEGSMGPYAGTTEGVFWLEMSEPRNWQVAGSQAGSGDYQLVTITAYGQSRPAAGGALCVGADGENAASSFVGMRTTALVGPVR